MQDMQYVDIVLELKTNIQILTCCNSYTVTQSVFFCLAIYYTQFSIQTIMNHHIQ